MRQIGCVAADVLREAMSRKWFLALGLGITLALTFVGIALRLDVVDGALAATRFFGSDVHTAIRSVDVAMRPVLKAAAYLVFYGGLAFGVLACADFGPSVFAPGRIEHLLALPVRRVELLVGTFVGVVGLSIGGALYGSGGLVLILGVKTGVWTAGPLVSAMLATVAFSSVYACMLASAVFVRSAALSAAVGGVFYVAGIVAGYRHTLLPMFERGFGRTVFIGISAVIPRISALADTAADLAASAAINRSSLSNLIAGSVVFGLGALAIGAWHFEQKDY